MSNKKESQNSISLSQDELDKLFNNSAPVAPHKELSKETESKIIKLKQKTKTVEKKLKCSSKKSEEKLTVYFENKVFGTGIVTTKNGKKVIELLTIKKK